MSAEEGGVALRRRRGGARFRVEAASGAAAAAVPGQQEAVVLHAVEVLHAAAIRQREAGPILLPRDELRLASQRLCRRHESLDPAHGIHVLTRAALLNGLCGDTPTRLRVLVSRRSFGFFCRTPFSRRRAWSTPAACSRCDTQNILRTSGEGSLCRSPIPPRLVGTLPSSPRCLGGRCDFFLSSLLFQIYSGTLASPGVHKQNEESRERDNASGGATYRLRPTPQCTSTQRRHGVNPVYHQHSVGSGAREH